MCSAYNLFLLFPAQAWNHQIPIFLPLPWWVLPPTSRIFASWNPRANLNVGSCLELHFLCSFKAEMTQAPELALDLTVCVFDQPQFSNLKINDTKTYLQGCCNNWIKWCLFESPLAFWTSLRTVISWHLMKCKYHQHLGNLKNQFKVIL